MEEVELVIVGAGPTGLFATFCAGLRMIKSVTLEATGKYGGQMSELYPQKIVYDMQAIPKMRAADIVERLYQQSQMFKNRVESDSDVTDIILGRDKRFVIEVNNKQKYVSRAVLICAGIGKFVPNRLNIPGESDYENKGVFYTVKNVGDFSDKDVVIMGGGDSAFDYAMQIEPVARSVTVVHHNNFLKAAEKTVEQARSKRKINIVLNHDAKEIVGDGRAVSRITIADNATGIKKNLDAGAIVVAIGHQAKPDAFKSLSLETEGRYIKVDSSYKTNIDGMYAAGDIANIGSEQKMALLSLGGGEAYTAINNIKKYLSPTASLFGGHSTSLNL